MIKYRSLTRKDFLWKLTFILALLVYIAGLFVTIMEIDAAVYAEVAMEMFKSGNYLEIFKKGTDWLDKPHFQFWMTAFSYGIFGINSFAYKLPAVLFALLGVRYTFLFGKRFYSKKHGYIAALMLMTAQHIITSNSDVRAEPYLTGWTIFALYYIAVYLEDKKIWQLVLGSFGLGCLLMTKGLFTIIPIGAGVFFALLYLKNWKQILHWQWLVVLVLTLLFTFPTLYGYYVQFDLHPEKQIFGRNGVSGIEFFFWSSQWGRFSNTGPIKGAGDPFFFVHTMIWAFMPWSILAFFALYDKAKRLIKKINTTENYTFFGFIFLFLIFSVSRFQLPHYLNSIYPLLAIVTTDTLFRFSRNRKFLKVFSHIQFWTAIALLFVLTTLHLFFSGSCPMADTILVVLFSVFVSLVVLKRQPNLMKQIIFIPVIILLAVNYYLNRDFYPKLLTYQAESEMAFYVKNNNIPAEKLLCFGVR